MTQFLLLFPEDLTAGLRVIRTEQISQRLSADVGLALCSQKLSK